MQGPTFDQWAVGIATAFRIRYDWFTGRHFPDLKERMPLAGPARVTILRVNQGEAVHFLLEAAPEKVEAECRHLTVTPPVGGSLFGWAQGDWAAYRRFVERTAGWRDAPAGHFAVFPDEQDEVWVVAAEAERVAMEHVRALRAA